jgi:NitT/TauT family transport system substrate-binding protein
MKRNRIQRWVALLLVGVLVIALTACGSSSTTSSDTTGAAANSSGTVIKLGYLPITHALAMFEEKELLDQENSDFTIELQKFSSWSDLTDALNAGRIDGASVLIELAMSAVSQGVDLKAVALGHRDGNVIVVSDDIQSVEDLKGKTFAIPHTQSSHNILLNDMLAKGGLTTNDITIVQMAPSEMPSSLASKTISGYCVAEPFGAQAVEQGLGHVLYTSEELWENSLCCGLVLNQTFIDQNPDLTDKLIEKYMEAGNGLTDETEKTIAEKYLGQDEAVLDTSLQWIQYNDLEITEEAYQTLVDKVIAYGINDNPPSYEDFVYQTK